MTKSELQAKALELPEEERRSLGMLLVDSTLPPLSDEQKRQIDERLRSHLQSPEAGENWHECNGPARLVGHATQNFRPLA